MFRVRRLSASTVSVTRLNYAPSTLGIMQIEDQKASGTNGGTSLVGEQIRDLNTVVANTIAGASLSGDQVTLPSGSYIIFAQSANHTTNRNVLRLYNVTDSAYIASSLSSHSQSTASSTIPATFKAYFSITSVKAFSLSHNIQSNISNVGLGLPTDRGPVEIYSQVFIQKIG